MVRPERFELPASWFVARRSIQLSYGRARGAHITTTINERHWDAIWRRGRDYSALRASPFGPPGTGVIPASSLPASAGSNPTRIWLSSGGEGGIRTLDGLLTHTPLAGARLRPLGHLSGWYKPIRGARDDTRPEQSR